MKTLFLPVIRAWTIRDLIRSGFTDQLMQKGVRVVLLMTFYTDELIKEMKERGMEVETIPILHKHMPKRERAIRLLRNTILVGGKQPPSYKIHMQEVKQYGKLKYYGYRFFTILLSNPIVRPHVDALRRFSEWLEIKLTGPFDSYYAKLFDKYKPDAVLTYSNYDYDSVPIFRVAKRGKIPIIGVELSWDNISSKGEHMVQYDELVVWNENLRGEAKYYMDYKDEHIHTIGAPPFNNFVRLKNRLLPKKQFFEKLGFDPRKKLITYTTASPLVMPYNNEVVELVVDGIQEGKIRNAQLLVRVYSRDDPKQYEKFKGMKDVFVDDSIHRKMIFPDGYDDDTEIIWLGSTMKNSDVVINICSSTTIDASVFDTPVINVVFDGKHQLPYLQSCRKWYDYEHYQKIVKTGGVKLTFNKEELYDAINDYLEHPEKDREGRRVILKEQCHVLDGKALDRLRDIILKTMNL